MSKRFQCNHVNSDNAGHLLLSLEELNGIHRLEKSARPVQTSDSTTKRVHTRSTSPVAIVREPIACRL